MPRRVLRIAFVAIAVLTGLGAMVVVGTWVWLGTDAGQRFILERLRAPLRGHGLELDADRVSGTVFSSLRLNGLTLRLCAQKISIRARSADVQYGLMSIIRGAPVVSVAVDEPVVDTNSDATCGAAPGGAAPSLLPRVVLRSLEIHKGVVGAGSRHLSAIELQGDGMVDRDGGGAPALTFHITKASALIFSEPGDSHLELSGQVAPDKVDVDLTAAVTRDDLARHAAGAVSAGPVALHLHVAGPPGALRLEGQVTTALGQADVSGTIDGPGRHADLALATKRVVIAPAGSDVEIAASARLRLVVNSEAGGDKDEVRLNVRGHGDYTRRGFDPSLAGAAMRRHLEDLPGGSWSGTAEGSLGGDGLSSRFHIDLSSEGKREAAPASIVLSGKMVVPRTGRPRLEANVAARDAVTR
jgi:hypothetical protein